MSTTNGVTQGSMLQVGQRIRPQVSPQQAKLIAETLYGVQVTSVKELDSYDDRNFHIKISESHSNPHLTWSRHGYVLKVLNSMDSKKHHVDAEHEVQQLLHRKGIACPLPVLNVHGRDTHLQDLTSNSPHNDGVQEERNMVRLMTFVPGQILDSVKITAPLLQDFGRTLARIHTVLKGYGHPALEGHQTVWSLSSVPAVRQFTYAVEDQQRRDMVLAIIDAFEAEVLANEDSFRKGIIHGDLNDQNTLVGSVTQEDGQPTLAVCGVLDFGDVQDSYLLYDLGISIMYALVVEGDPDTERMSQVAGHIVTGYLAGQDIPAAEWKVLPLTVCARMVQSLVMGAYSYSLDPGNDYLLTTAASGWPLLQALWSTPATTWRRAWADVCKQNVCNASFDDDQEKNE